MTDTDIKNEIVQLIEGRQKRLPADWIVKSVMAVHGPAEGDNAEFYDYCAHHHVRAVVRQTLQRWRVEETEVSPDQLILPGFERLQQRYIVTQADGEMVAVPIDQMSDDEIRLKIAELYRTAQGCAKHAKELERFLGSRASEIAA